MFPGLATVQEAASMPIGHFYTDWTFWQGLVAFLALILSQLPPLVTYLKRPRLAVDVHQVIRVTHYVGNPNLNLFVSIQNIGGRDIRVRSTSVIISRNGTMLTQLPSQGYFEKAGLPNQSLLLMVPFILKPKELWAHNIAFYKLIDRQTDKSFRANRAVMQRQIRERIKERPAGDQEPVKVDKTIYQPFIDLFNRQFIWEPGEYQLQLKIDASPPSAGFTKAYRFTLFESDTTELREHLDDYPIGGGGLTFQSESTKEVWAPITEV